MGDVRLWGMGAEQVASILRQAGQDSIRLVVARPVDPSVPQFAVSYLFSTTHPTRYIIQKKLFYIFLPNLPI